MPASDSAGDLLLVALKMPPSRIGTYSNFVPVRASIAGIASWLRKAFGLPKSNRNCADVGAKAASLQVVMKLPMRIVPRRAAGVHCFDDDHNTLMTARLTSDQPLDLLSAPHQHVIAHLQEEHGAEADRIGHPDPLETESAAEQECGRNLDGGDGQGRQRERREHGAAGTHHPGERG